MKYSFDLSGLTVGDLLVSLRSAAKGETGGLFYIMEKYAGETILSAPVDDMPEIMEAFVISLVRRITSGDNLAVFREFIEGLDEDASDEQ